MSELSAGQLLSILGFILTLMGGGGLVGWLMNGYKMRSELMPREECDQRRASCGVVQTSQMNDIWSAVDEIRKDIKELIRAAGRRRKADEE